MPNSIFFSCLIKIWKSNVWPVAEFLYMWGFFLGGNTEAGSVLPDFFKDYMRFFFCGSNKSSIRSNFFPQMSAKLPLCSYPSPGIAFLLLLMSVFIHYFFIPCLLAFAFVFFTSNHKIQLLTQPSHAAGGIPC